MNSVELCLNSKPRQRVTLFVIDTAGFECFPNWFVCDGVESFREVDRCYRHFDTPLMAFLFNHSVRRMVVRCLVRASNSKPDLPLVLGRVVGIIFRTESSRKVCTTQTMIISDSSYLHFPRHLSCVTLLFSLSSRLHAWIHFVLWFRRRSVTPFLSSPRHKLRCLLLESRRCLVIYLLWVSWSHLSILHSWPLKFSSILQCRWCARQCCFHFHIRLAHSRRKVFCIIHQRHWRSLSVM